MGTITRLPILRRPPRTPGHSFRIHRAERWLTQLVFFAVTTRTRPRVSHDKNKQKNSSVQSLNRFRSDFITTCSLSSLQYLIAWKTSVAMMDFFPQNAPLYFWCYDSDWIQNNLKHFLRLRLINNILVIFWSGSTFVHPNAFKNWITLFVVAFRAQSVNLINTFVISKK